MRELIGSFLKVLVYVAIALVLINDVGRYIAGGFEANRRAGEIAEATLVAYQQTENAVHAERIARQNAEADGLLLYSIHVDKSAASVEVIAPVRSTVLLARLPFLSGYHQVHGSATRKAGP